MQVLDLAIGTPDVGCLNLNLLFVCLKKLIVHNRVRIEMVHDNEQIMHDAYLMPFMERFGRIREQLDFF